ncbi:YibE/F family protein [Gracilibacillus massiliensis]|uniref:YibE/F family protein n=1 Tax=Gracilibacillus massiliensis TaxID=1564956 RepID=UPI00071C2E99|nr:YibE/F family protein [Gracilibacillus massiliensis]
MNALILLSLILFILMTLIGGKKGVKTFIALFLNFGVLLVTILIMNDPNASPVLLSLIASIVISMITLFFIHEVNRKMVMAFFSTIATTILLLLFIVVITDRSMIQGFGPEEADGLYLFSLAIGLDFVEITISVIIMSTIGAILDTAIAISSPMQEIHQQNPMISRKDLFKSGMSIGRDILGTSTNTLFFAFFGGYLGLLIWLKDFDYSLGEMVNAKVFSDELIAILMANTGIALVIPITAAMSAYFYHSDKQPKETKTKEFRN